MLFVYIPSKGHIQKMIGFFFYYRRWMMEKTRILLWEVIPNQRIPEMTLLETNFQITTYKIVNMFI